MKNFKVTLVSSISIKECTYKALTRPAVEFASCLWDPYTKKGIANVESVQRHVQKHIKCWWDANQSQLALSSIQKKICKTVHNVEDGPQTGPQWQQVFETSK